MVKRSRTKSASTRRYKKQATPNSRVVVMRNPRYTAPAGIEVVLKYTTRLDLTSAVSYYNSAVFRGAGPFDPEVALGGHQPLGYDQWAAIYQRQRTISCRIVADFSPGILEASDGCIPWICATETLTGFTNADSYIESPFSVHGPQLQARGTSNKRLTMNIKTAQFEGDSGALYDKDYASDIGGLPTRDWYYHVGITNQDPSVGLNVEGFVNVTLYYTIRFYDRIDMGRS